MKYGIYAVILALALCAVFFPGASAFADGDHAGPQTTAMQAGSANDEDTMKNFVLHAKRHLDAAIADKSSAALYRKMREEGVWKDGSVYLINLYRSGRVLNHGKYTKSLYGDSLAALPVVENLISRLEGGGEEPVCVEYDSKWSCAVLYTPEVGIGRHVLIGGFDHPEDDVNIARLVCPDYQPEVTAEDVSASQYISESEALKTLQGFVKGAVKRFTELQTGQGSGTLDPQDALERIACWSRGPWKAGPIYLFIMDKPAERAPTVVFNGNNPELTGSVFENVLDEDGVDIGEIILKAVETEEKGGIVKYKWDNPVIEEDNLSEANMSPGRSPKTSYVQAVKFRKRDYIFGSGIYGTLEGDGGSGDAGGDDGCAVAGTGSKPAGAVFSLFLVAFSLCLVLWRRERSRK